MSSETSETRRKILQATVELLEGGPGQTVRMADVARRAGISRQAVYLHFPTRTALLIAAARFVEEINDSERRLAASRAATSGVERLDAYIEAWAGYIPEIFSMAQALLAMRDTDEAAATAWDGRMQAMREGCEAAVAMLHRDGTLRDIYEVEVATDVLWTLLSVRNWEQWTRECGWTQRDYITRVQGMARRLFVAEAPQPSA